MKTENVSAIVLAGGYSRRMGKNKVELRLGGQTLLEIQVRKLRRLGFDDIMISGYDNAPEGTRAIEDIYQQKGPLGGVHACLKAAKKPACLVMSVDVPLFPEEWIEKLAEAHEGGATVLSYHGEIEPLLAVYDADLAQRAEELILAEERAVRRLANNPKVKKVEFTGDEQQLLNCNTTEEFEKAAALYQSGC
jgi:molybdopterin-guanine dinucleotide biosynthesis protein A